MPNKSIPQSKKTQTEAVKSDFDTVEPVTKLFYTDSSNTVGMTHGQILTTLQGWNAAPANLAEATANLNALAALVGLLVVVVAWLLRRELARKR